MKVNGMHGNNPHLESIIQRSLYGSGDFDQLSSAMFGIALTTRGKSFLELGVRSGCSTLPLLTAAKLLGASLTSVDIDTPQFVCPEDLVDRWNFVKSDAISFLTQNKTKYDLIFIDDWHDGIHVKTELDLIAPFCDKSTVILLHDLMYGWTNPNYNKSDSGFSSGWGVRGEFDNGGPYWAITQMDADIWEYSTLPFCNGLTLMRRK